MAIVGAFDYPLQPHTRLHGPSGYEDYQSFRDWLRDEFSFRCLFCLKRERWDLRCNNFHIEHFIPQAVAPALACDYDNLLYSCATCNSKKGDLSVPDPSVVAYGGCLAVHADGTIEAIDDDGQALIYILCLDDADHTHYRRMILDIARVPEYYSDWMSYPDDLPDLGTRRPPTGNRRPEGVARSCFARRARNELPACY